MELQQHFVLYTTKPTLQKHQHDNVTTSTLKTTSTAKVMNDLCTLYTTTSHIKNAEGV